MKMGELPVNRPRTTHPIARISTHSMNCDAIFMTFEILSSDNKFKKRCVALTCRSEIQIYLLFPTSIKDISAHFYRRKDVSLSTGLGIIVWTHSNGFVPYDLDRWPFCIKTMPVGFLVRPYDRTKYIKFRARKCIFPHPDRQTNGRTEFLVSMIYVFCMPHTIDI